MIEKARAIGNSVQASRTKGEFFDQLAAAGFPEPEIVDEMEVDANQGFIASKKVETVEGDEDAKFAAVALNVRKPK